LISSFSHEWILRGSKGALMSIFWEYCLIFSRFSRAHFTEYSQRK
jgi:hypothetical protein